MMVVPWLCADVGATGSYDDLVRSGIFKEHVGCYIAFCQHPVCLIIDEYGGEPTVGETVPAWDPKYRNREIFNKILKDLQRR
jgi:hypothetical protein